MLVNVNSFTRQRTAKLIMPSAMDMDGPAAGGGEDQKRQAVITVNDLNYILEPDLSCAVNATHKNHFFQSPTYTNNQRAICILNSGADYIDTTRSTLNFSLQNSSDNAYHFGPTGSVLNIFNRITISTRSGDELSRIRGANLLCASKIPYVFDRDWLSSIGSAIGFGNSIRANSTKYFSVPLYLLTDLFGYGRLLPSMLMSGLRIEIEWESTALAFQQQTDEPAVLSEFTLDTTTDPNDQEVSYTAGDAAAPAEETDDYTVGNIFINAKSVQLTDATQRALNELSAVNGLEIVYPDWETTETTISVNSVNMEVRKASSRALQAIVRMRLSDNITDSPFGKDCFAGDMSVTQYQWQLGSLYFPQQPVKSRSGNAADMEPEAYTMTLDAFNKLKPTARPPAVGLISCPLSLAQNPKSARFGDIASVLAVTLERSSLFNLSGVPINNSRVLSFQANFDDADDRTITIFLKYVKLARVFLNNVEVEQ